MSSPSFPVELVDARLGAPWLKQFRSNAVDKLTDAAMPDASEEIWRYSRVDDVNTSDYSLASQAISEYSAELKDKVGAIFAGFDDATLLVTLDGDWARDYSAGVPDVEDKGVKIGTLADSAVERDVVGDRDDVFIIANDAFATGLVIDVPEKLQLDLPILVVHVISQPDSMSFPRLDVRVGSLANATIIECFVSASVSALTIPIAEIELGKAAQLHHVVIQNLANTVTSIARQTSRLERDATLSSANLVFGGDFARVRNDTALSGEGSTSNLSAVYFGENNQMHDFRTLQEHTGAHSKSDLFFRGAVADKAHAVYSGLIRIRKGAHGTDATQSNRTLKLSPEAVADSVPNLEIDENDVKCSHASAVGPIGEEERYYLESRGIPTAEAERLIVLGFLDQVFARIPIEGVVNYARQILQQKWEAHS